jgi:hypothetical protein
MQRRTRSLATLPLVVALLAVACGGSEEPQGSPMDAEEDARLERAMASLDDASDRVRAEVLRTCDKWRHLDRPCVENEVRRDQLDCWLAEGLAKWKNAMKRGMGPFGGDRTTMRVQNLCMEKRRWRKIERSKF